MGADDSRRRRIATVTLSALTKQSLVYDLEEPFRWIVDLSVVQAFESGALDLPHFFFTGDDYRYRFSVEPKTRFLNLLREQFNSGVNYKGRVLKWDTVIEQKTTEFSRLLVGRSRAVDFTEPIPNLKRTDNLSIRKRILSLTQEDARRIGVGKSTLHYLRKNASRPRTFRVYSSTHQKLVSC